MLLQKKAQNNKVFLFTEEINVITTTPPNILPTPKNVPKRPNCLLLKFNWLLMVFEAEDKIPPEVLINI